MKIDIQKDMESIILKKVLNDRIENINVILTRAGGSGDLIQEQKTLQHILFNISRSEKYSIN